MMHVWVGEKLTDWGSDRESMAHDTYCTDSVCCGRTRSHALSARGTRFYWQAVFPRPYRHATFAAAQGCSSRADPAITMSVITRSVRRNFLLLFVRAMLYAYWWSRLGAKHTNGSRSVPGCRKLHPWHGCAKQKADHLFNERAMLTKGLHSAHTANEVA